MSKIRALAPDDANFKLTNEITTKQWIVYYYLLSISKWDAVNREDHYYFYTGDLNVSKISSFLGMSRSTFYTAFDKLYHKGIIYEDVNNKGKDVLPDQKVKIKTTKIFYITIPKIYAELERNLLTFLLGYQKFVGIDLLRTYIILKKAKDVSDGKRYTFTKRFIVGLLGHNKHDSHFFEQVEIYLGMLSYWGLIKLSKRVVNDENIGHYAKFTLEEINDRVPEALEGEEDAPVDEELFNKVKEALKSDPFWEI